MLKLDFGQLHKPAPGKPGANTFQTTSQGYAFLVIDGDDARAFLQGQVTNDVDSLTMGHNRLAAICNPQGRVVATFDLLATQSGYIAVLPENLADTLTTHLTRYVLRSKVTIELGTSPSGIRAVQTSKPPLASGECEFNQDGFIYRPSWQSDDTCAWLMTNYDDHERFTAQSSEQPLSWSQAHVLWGFAPSLLPTTGQHVAQMLNLDALGAISFTKGCYTGQEIIARIHHRGTVKRRLRRFFADEKLALNYNDELHDESGAVAGNVVEFAVDDHGQTGVLAVVKQSTLGAPLRLNDVTLEPWSLPYALVDE